MYFDLNLVTDPPNDELVNHETQLNANWREIADKINRFNQSPADFSGIANLPKGTEGFTPEDPTRIGVWNGVEWSRGLNHNSSWTAWQPLGLRSPVVARPGYAPMAKVNVVSRRIALQGGVLYSAAADPWPTNSTIQITDDTSIQYELQPANGGLSVQQGATGQITTANGFACAAILIQRSTTPVNHTGIYVRYQGDAGGGNFVMLDGIEWWY